MTRRKVKLAYIVNDSARKATFKKRKKGLLKKVDELSTLCGIEACAIVYSPYDPQPEVWPSARGVQKVLSKFKTMPELEQSKKMMNQEIFLKQRIHKTKEQVKKQRRDNREKEMTLLMFQFLSAGTIFYNNMTTNDMDDLLWLIDQNMKDVNRRLETLHKDAPQIMTPSQPQMVAPPPMAVANTEETTPGVHGHRLDMHADTTQQMLFMDMINGNWDGTMPFGDANLQNVFWPNLLP